MHFDLPSDCLHRPHFIILALFHLLFLCLLTRPLQYLLIAALFKDPRCHHYQRILSFHRVFHLVTMIFNHYSKSERLQHLLEFVINLFQYVQRFEFHLHCGPLYYLNINLNLNYYI